MSGQTFQVGDRVRVPSQLDPSGYRDRGVVEGVKRKGQLVCVRFEPLPFSDAPRLVNYNAREVILEAAAAAADTTPAIARLAQVLLIAEHGEHADMYRPDMDTARAALDAALDVDELAELFELCGPADARPMFDDVVEAPAGWADCMCGNGPGIWAGLEAAKRHQAYVIRIKLLGAAS